MEGRDLGEGCYLRSCGELTAGKVWSVKEAASASGGFIEHLCALHSVGRTLEAQMVPTFQEFLAQWKWDVEAYAI